MTQTRNLRDTDADWRELGATEPFWGVLTDPQFKSENLNPQAIEIFYNSGREHADSCIGHMEALAGAPVRMDRALDFGCGVGRLSEAMTRYADQVVGYDISSGMLAQARASGSGAVTYVEELPDGPFDWINSFIVFQHIPPERGMELLGRLLDRLAVGGWISLHFTIWRDDHLKPPPPAPPQKESFRDKFKRQVRRVIPYEHPLGTIHMFDYDLGAIVEAVNRRGIERMTLVSTDHGGHHGVLIVGRRDA